MKHPNLRPCAEFPSDNPNLHLDEAAGHGGGFDWDATERRAKELSSSWSRKPDAPETFPPILESLTDVASSASVVAPDSGDPDPFISELFELIDLGSEELPPEFGDEPVALEESGEMRTLPRVEVAPRERTELVPVVAGVQPLAPLDFELTPTPAHVSPWTELTATLSRHLLSQGYTRAAALITPLLNAELVDLSRLPPNSLELLVVGSVAEKRGGLVVSTAGFREAARAFREEFYGGGLDADEALFWLSQLLFALTGGDDEEEVLEGTLRELGVAELLAHAA